MSPLPRGHLRSKGYEVLQAFDAMDALGVAYDYSTAALTPPMNFGARYAWAQRDGLWQQQTVADTKGPIGGWLCWPAGGHVRQQAQWAQVFPVQITNASPLQAVPIQKLASGLVIAPDLDDTFAVTAIDSSSPAVNDFGVVVQPSRLDAQDPIFVPCKGSSGGGGGGTFFGDGVDGSVHLDGTLPFYKADYFIPPGTPNPGYLITQTPFPDNNIYGAQNPATYVNGLKYYFLWRNAYFDTLTLDAGVVLFTNGYAVYANKIIGPGTIDTSGDVFNVINAFPGLAPGSGYTVYTLVSGAIQGSVVPPTTTGSAFPRTVLHVPNALDAGGMTNGYCYGGAGGAGTGGPGDPIEYALGEAFGVGSSGQTLHALLSGVLWELGFTIVGGQPGSSGGPDTGFVTGALGGCSGGICTVAARDMHLFTGVLRAVGGPGDSQVAVPTIPVVAPTGQVNFGGGGGGSGGVIAQSTDTTATPSKTWTTVVSAGAGGTGGGTGSVGSAGFGGLSQGTYP